MIPVLVNAAGGAAAAKGDALRRDIEAAFAANGTAIDLKFVEGSGMADAVAVASSADTVVIGGGDGTVSGAAGVLAGRDVAFGILPLGTLNHLARELGIPADLPGAARVIAGGATRRIDLGEVNGRVFVNNTSIGLYPAMVARREASDAPKWAAAVPAAWAALKRMRHHRLRLDLPGGAQDLKTPLLFVGNNRYRLDAGAVGQRAALDDGVLSVFAVADRARLALIGFALRTLLGRADPVRDFAAIGEAAGFRVEGHGWDAHVAVDGEVVELAFPLEFTVRAGALTVIVPAV